MKAMEIVDQLKSLADKNIAQNSQRFFKTGAGEYGAGDQFLGIRMPTLRMLVKQHKNVPLNTVAELLRSPYHEIRIFSALLLVSLFESNKKDPAVRHAIYQCYLANTLYINNWDIVDCSAHKIVGMYLLDQDRSVLYSMANSISLWERRIAMMSTYTFIKNNQFDDTFKIAELLLADAHDLIHKVVGWMLREVGNRDKIAEQSFLKIHYQNMPRTMLRYAIEKFDKDERHKYLQGLI